MTQIDEFTLQRCKSLINDEIGIIDDLPAEVQNTIANIYYKISQLMLEYERKENIPSSVRLSDNIIEGIRKFFSDSAFLISARKNLPELISLIRQLRDQNKDEFEFMIFCFLCQFKYRIQDVMNKTELRLRFERKLRKSKVDEIENLHLLLH